MQLSKTDKRFIRTSVRIELLGRLDVIRRQQRNDAESIKYVSKIERTLMAALETCDLPAYEPRSQPNIDCSLTLPTVYREMARETPPEADVYSRVLIFHRPG